MLVLSRKAGEQIVIGPKIRVTVLEIQNGRVRLGFAAPRELPIHRQEVLHRAGVARARRAAIYFLDDATRFGLGVCVCTSEQAEVVLLLLNRIIRQYGLMDLLFWDGGPGFKDHEVLYVATKLGVHPVHGRAPRGAGACRPRRDRIRASM